MPVIVNGSTGITTPASNTTGTETVTTLSSPAATALTIQSGGTTAMTISTGLSVGIGTTTPTQKLDVFSNSASYSTITARNTVSGFNFAIAGTGDAQVTQTGAYSLQFATNNTEQMRIDANGNVGIGTSSPSTYGQFVVYSATTGVVRSVGSAVTSYMYASNSGSIGAVGTETNHPFTFNTNNTERARIDANGNFLIGTTTVNYAGNGFTLSKDSGTTKWLVGPTTFSPTNFYVTAVNSLGVYLSGTSATSWASSSDERLKNIIEPIANGLQKVNTLRAVIGSYKADETKTRHAFLIAQDLQKVLPEAVDASNPNALGAQYTEVIPLLVAAIKELSAKNDALEAINAAFEVRLAALEAK